MLLTEGQTSRSAYDLAYVVKLKVKFHTWLHILVKLVGHMFQTDRTLFITA